MTATGVCSTRDLKSATAATDRLPLTRRALAALTRYREARDAGSRRHVAEWAKLAPPEEAALVRLLENVAAVGPLAGRGVERGTAARLLTGLAPSPGLVATDLARAAEWRTPAALFGLESQLEETMEEMTLHQRAEALIAERGIDVAQVVPASALAYLAGELGASPGTVANAVKALRRERGITVSRQQVGAYSTMLRQQNGHAPTEPAAPRKSLKERIEQELERRGLFLGEMIPEADKHEMAEALDTTYASLVTALVKMRNGRGIRFASERAQEETDAQEESGVTAGEITAVTKADLQAAQQQAEETPAAAAIPEPAPIAAPTAIPAATVEAALLELKRERLRAVLIDLGLSQVQPESLRPVLREIALGGGD